MTPDPWAITEPRALLPAGIEALDLRLSVEQLIASGAAQRRGALSDMTGFLTSILEIADALERTMAGSADDSVEAGARLRRNVAAVAKLLNRTLSRQGVERLHVVGAPADQAVVDIVDEVVDPRLPEDCVVREVVPGYSWNGRALRRPQVVVATRSSRADAGPGQVG